MKMRKLFAGLLATSIVAAGASAFAAPIANDAGYIKADGTYSITADSAKQIATYGTDQTTIIIIPEAAFEAKKIEDGDILYIDQVAADTKDIFTEVGILGGTELAPGKYYVKIGGENLSEDGFIVETFEIKAAGGGEGTKYIVGDTDGDKLITTADATKVFKYIVDASKFATTVGVVLPKNVGDADADQLITTADASLIYQEILTPGTIKVNEYTLPAGQNPESTY